MQGLFFSLSLLRNLVPGVKCPKIICIWIRWANKHIENRQTSIKLIYQHLSVVMHQGNTNMQYDYYEKRNC